MSVHLLLLVEEKRVRGASVLGNNDVIGISTGCLNVNVNMYKSSIKEQCEYILHMRISKERLVICNDGTQLLSAAAIS